MVKIDRVRWDYNEGAYRFAREEATLETPGQILSWLIENHVDMTYVTTHYESGILHVCVPLLP